MPLPIKTIFTVFRWVLTRAPTPKVILKEAADILEIYTADQELICTHKISSKKGQLIANTNYKRDTPKSLDQMMLLATSYFTDK
ncbi:hypothetical protein ACKGJN_11500 [Gillisia sp. Q332]|uniref:hypothetical protein n=1 Tax=Gillisia xinjiangensis TaxID=3384765 RepID=UPI00391B32A0